MLARSPESKAHDKVLDNNPDRIGIWKCWFLRRGENRNTRRKTSQSKEDNQQQTRPIYDAGSGNRTRDTFVEGERSHHCANPVPSLCHPCMKVYEGAWRCTKFMKAYEGVLMKVYEGVWRFMKVCGGAWRCMKVHEGVWRFMKVYGGVWRCMKVHEGVWRFMKVCEIAWRCRKVYEGLWKCMKVHGGLEGAWTPAQAIILQWSSLQWNRLFVCQSFCNIVTQCWYQVFWLAVFSEQVAINFNLLTEKTVFLIGILWVNCDGKQHYLCFKEGKSNFPLVVRLSKSKNVLKASSQFTSNRLQYSFKVPAKWDGGSVKTRMERTHYGYSKCGGICGVLQGL